MSDSRAALLVARRELVERARSRAFQVSTAVLLLLVAAVSVLPGMLGSDAPTRRTVGAVGSGALAIAQQAERQARGASDLRIDVRRLPDAAAARVELEGGNLDVALVGFDRLLAAQALPGDLLGLLQGTRRDLAVLEQLADAGVPEPERSRALATPLAPVELLDADAADIDTQRNLAFAGVFLLYLAVLTYGIWVANGVVEEKSSRVVELLLSAIRPTPLLAGKILGIGLLGLAQTVLVTAVGLGLALATDAVDLPGTTAGGAAQLLLWFLLGFALYAALYAVAGTLVSRQEDLASSTGPLTFVLIAAFVVAVQVIADPASTLAVVATLVPFTAPVVVPARAVLGELPLWQGALAVALTLAATAGLTLLAARIYAATVLQTAPLGLGAALRLARARRAPNPAT